MLSFMNVKNKKAILFGLAILFLFSWWALNHYQSTKICICRELKPGITSTEINAIFGEPFCKEEIDGEIWLSYQSDEYASVPIRARIDQKTGIILELICDEGAPEWILDKDPRSD
jgi:hypothetical protein